MIGALSSEWAKIRSVTSTYFLLGALGAFLLLCLLWSWFIAGHWDGLAPARRAELESAPAEQPLVLALPVCAVVAGALAVTSEYATGLMRSSLAAVPRRVVLFAAKVVVVGGSVLVAGTAAVTAAVAAGRVIVGDRPIPAFAGTVGDQAPHLLAMGGWAAALALAAFGLGTALRSTAATITAMVVLLFVLPPVAGLFPAPWDERVVSFLPAALPDQIAAAPETPETGVLSPAAAATVLTAYALTPLALGAAVFARRDA